jgi:hypothetical protein
MRTSFEAKYRSITRWVKELTRIEIAYILPTETFSQALDQGLG